MVKVVGTSLKRKGLVTAFLRSYLKFLTQCGFEYVSLDRGDIVEVNSLVLPIINLVSIMIAATNYVIIDTKGSIFSNNFGWLTARLIYMVLAGGYMGALLESIVHRKRNIKFWWKFKLVQAYHGMPSVIDELTPLVLKFIWKFLLYLAVTFFVTYVRIDQSMGNRKFLQYAINYYILAFGLEMRAWQYVLYVSVLEFKIRQLHEQIQQTGEHLNLLRNSSVPEKEFKKFISSSITKHMKCYHLLYGMSVEIDRIFGFSVLARIMSSFVEIVSCLYYLYWQVNITLLQNGPIIEQTLAGLSGILQTSLIIPIILFTTSKCKNAVTSIAWELHNMNVKKDELSVKIENFSLQLLHERITFEAKGCFALDLNFIAKLCGTITTNICVFIKFLPGKTFFDKDAEEI